MGTDVRVLVTGGAGFVGSHLTDALVRRGDHVVVLDDLTTGYVENIPPGARLVVGDVADAATVAEAVEGVEVVFHLAASRAVLRSVQEPRATDRANTGGTLNVLESARHAGVRRVVAASSSSVYGGDAAVPTPESASPRPRSPYAVSKVAGRALHPHLLGTPPAGDRGTPTVQRLRSSTATRQPLCRGDPSIHRSPGRSRPSRGPRRRPAEPGTSPTWRTPWPPFWAPVPARPRRCAGRVYNVAGGREQSLLDLLAALRRILGVDIPARHVEPRPGDVRRSRADLTAAAAGPGLGPDRRPRRGPGGRTVTWFASRPQTSP